METIYTHEIQTIMFQERRDSKARDESAPVTERWKKTRETPHTISVFLFTVSSVVSPST
jgi:hypothetical protein